MKLFLGFFCLILLCGCSAPQATLTADAETLMTEIRSSVRLPAVRQYAKGQPNADDILKNYYGLRESQFPEDFCVLVPYERNYTEIAIFLSDDPAVLDTITQALRKRKENMVTNCRYTDPQKLPKLKNSLIRLYTNGVIFTVCEDTETDPIRAVLDKRSQSMV